MAGEYNATPEKIAISRFKEILKNKDLLPGRLILKSDIDSNFDKLISFGINNLKELLQALNKTNQINELVCSYGLDPEYLKILKREANSYLPKVYKLSDISLLDEDYLSKLHKAGIKNSKQLFENSFSIEKRKQLSEETEIPVDELTQLASICDLLRVTGIGPVFAVMLIDACVKSARELIEYDRDSLFDRLIDMNKTKDYTNAKFSVKDIEYCQELGKGLPIYLEL